jgi:TPR repeat protein
MGKKGKKAQAGKPKKLTPKDVGKRLDALAKKLEEELEGADLFAPMPPTEDCAICLVPLSRLIAATYYSTCCGNLICKACYKENEESIEKQNEENTGKKVAFTCPFCREPKPTREEDFVRLQARGLQNDPNAFMMMASIYREGGPEAPKDDLKALDCLTRAVELGSAEACSSIGSIYDEGTGVAANKERAALFERIGAVRGSVVARHNIGVREYNSGSHGIGISHFKIAAEAGNQVSLDELRGIYNADGKEPGKEFISKEYLDKVYRACHGAQMKVKSEEREKHSKLTGVFSKMKC